MGLDPNGASGMGVAWPAYNLDVGGGVGQNMVWTVQGSGSYVETDSYRSEGIGWFIDRGLSVFGN